MGAVNAAPRLQNVYAAYPPGFWVLWVGTLINRVGEFVVPLLGFYLASQRHMSVGQISIILSVMGLGRFFAEGGWAAPSLTALALARQCAWRWQAAQ